MDTTVIVSAALSLVFFYAGYKILFAITVLILLDSLWLLKNKKTPKPRGEIKVNPNDVTPDAGKEGTDLTKWHLEVERGRQVWRYNEKQTSNEQTFADKYFLGLYDSKKSDPLPKPNNATEATKNSLEFYSKLQLEDGHWGNDYGGPMFLLPGLVFTSYITKTDLGTPYKKEIIRYLTGLQRSDGGWGLHIESKSTMFGTVMNYCAMRLLGVTRSDQRMIKARKWIEAKGGAVSVPAWGKFWLSALGVYSWEGMNPVPPELWVLPYFLPFHPGRWWCHCRVVYLPMAWVYGSRNYATQKADKIIKELREEIYVQEYDTIDWDSQCMNVFAEDNYKGHSPLFKVAFGILKVYERFHIKSLRKYALDTTLDHIRYEDRETHGICIGPVNKTLDMLCEYWASEGKSEAFKLHQDRLLDYLWLAADGLKMQGYNGSQLWDTAFSLQAILETRMGDKYDFVRETMKKGYHYVDITQVRENNVDKEKYYRHISKGAWPFSTIDHGWPISDCTAEGFKCALEMPKLLPYLKEKAIDISRIHDSVNVMLSYQNEDGGWPSYENQRGPAWLEMINPADCFDGIMVDYSYVECSSACIQALLKFRKYYPEHRKNEINAAVARGVEFLKSKQKPDGGWHGCWGVCYTYAGWFACSALSECLELGIGTGIKPVLEKGWKFLLEKQKPDGSWGEDFKSCCERKWVEAPVGHVVNTAWALLALMRNPDVNKSVIDRGIQFLVKMQLPNGDWEQGTVSGVFNYNCAISYSGYKNIFPIWALGEYINRYPQK
eukprot:TRINITY_DN3518_c0_g1_i1.p1 TRINITY_DN3518_c0_g1~~TRINITY_DN3518_c0_g1_i1.p1  ORF type:complete len:776 (-),score=192.12 TRINITY_DN3518_c0_g1_i1:88-2415(-)